jgi:hypothetical protein
MTSKLVLFVVILLLFSSGNLSAFKFATGRGIGLGQTVILSRSSASTLVSVPTGGIASGDMKLELGAARKFGMKDLDQAFVAVAYRYRHITPSLGLTQFGYSDLYRERTAKMGVAWQVDSLTIGTTLSALLVSFGGRYDRLDAATFGAGASYRTSRIIGAVAADNLTSPHLDKNSSAVNPTYSAYLEVLGEGSFSITGRMTLEKTERPQFALGQRIDISERGALFWGLSTAPLEYGGGVEVTVDKSHISYAASYHPTLGLSYSLSLSFEFSGSPKGKKEAP